MLLQPYASSPVRSSVVQLAQPNDTSMRLSGIVEAIVCLGESLVVPHHQFGAELVVLASCMLKSASSTCAASSVQTVFCDGVLLLADLAEKKWEPLLRQRRVGDAVDARKRAQRAHHRTAEPFREMLEAEGQV